MGAATPDRTSSTARTSSAARKGFSTYPDAPARSAFKTRAGISTAVSAMQEVFASSFLMARMTSSPLILGRQRSTRATSGFSFRARARPSSPEPATPQTSIPCDSSTCAIRRATASSSSMMTARTAMDETSCFGPDAHTAWTAYSTRKNGAFGVCDCLQPHRVAAPCRRPGRRARSVHDEELCAGGREGPVGFGVVGHLVAGARGQDEGPPVPQVCVQFALEAEQDMALGTPVVGPVARRVVHHADADAAELACAPDGHSPLALVLGGCDLRPVGGSEGDAVHVHGNLPWK